MPKRLIFLYRYITTPYRMRRWLNGQVLLVFIVMIAFLTALAATAPPSRASSPSETAVQNEMTATLAVKFTPTPTLDPEYIANSKQTIGITVVGAILVLIVVLGVVIFQPKEESV
jgi:hypothetical protein